MKRICLGLFLFFALALMSWAQGCYTSTRAQGIKLMEQGKYSQAIEYFKAAEDCPDKPENNDLAAKRSECQREIQRIADRKRQEEEDARRRRQQQEAANARKGYMDITRVAFSNQTASHTVLTDYGGTLYSGEMQYLRAKLYYNGLLQSGSKSIELKMKIFKPDGSLKTGTGSPSGYTWSENVTVYSGSSNTLALSGWGSDSGSYPAGDYRFEVWYDGNKLYSTTVRINEGGVSNLTVDGKTAVTTSFSSSGGSQVFQVSTDASSWIYWGVPTWCSVVDKTSTSFTLRCEANTSSSQRSDYMKIKAGNKEVRIDIKQRAQGENDLVSGDWRELMKKTKDNVTVTYSGSVYKGERNSSGIRQGFGMYAWENGSYYWGRWRDGDYNGLGIYISSESYTVKNCPDCVYYVGYYENDKKSGNGTCYDKNGKLIYYGSFKDNAPTETYPTSGYTAYKFECIKYSNGNMYVGETKNGKRHGRGIFLWENGDAWYGPWTDGERSGEGLYFFYSGSLLTGTWKGDVRSD